jgi:hypothetical protein
MIIIKYENESEVQAIVDTQTALGMHQIAVSNVGEGNFLGFDDRDVVQSVLPVTYTNQEIIDNQQTMKDAIADAYILIASIPGVTL